MKRKEIIKRLKKMGFTQDTRRGKGSHVLFWDRTGADFVTVPGHTEIAEGTAAAILKKAARVNERNEQ